MPRKRKEDDSNVLRDFRRRFGFTQQEAAREMNISRTLWSAWEARTRPITVAQLNRIQEVLKLEDRHVLELRRWWGQSCLREQPA